MKCKMLIISLLCFLYSFLFFNQISACECMPLTFERINNGIVKVDAIFVGKPRIIRPLQPVETVESYDVILEIEVLESWEIKSFPREFPKYVSLIGRIDSQCGTIFSENETYLFYAEIGNGIYYSHSFCGSFAIEHKQEDLDAIKKAKLKQLNLKDNSVIRLNIEQIIKDKNLDNQVVMRKYESKIQKLQAEFKEQMNTRFKYEMLALGLVVLIFLLWLGIRFIKF